MGGTRTAYQLSDWQHYMSYAEIDSMQNLASELPMDAVIVKIGAGAGTDTLAILEVTQDVIIFSIDIAAGEQPIYTNEHLRLAETGDDQTGTVVRIWGDSKIAGLRWPIPVDWVHVDGDHERNGIMGDIRTWFRHVRPGGFISFHDYDDPHWPAVKEVVDRMMEGQEYLEKFSADKFRSYRKRDG
jgi:SAM-dependent methyltransferase